MNSEQRPGSDSPDGDLPEDPGSAAGEHVGETQADAGIDESVAEPDSAGESDADSDGTIRQTRSRGSRLVPDGSRARAALALVLVLVLAVTGSALWLNSGRSLAGLQSGQGVLSFLPVRLPDGVAFEVGQHQVPESELEQRIEVLSALYGIETPGHEDERDQFRRDIAKSYAVSLVLDHEAAEHDVSVAEKQARDTLTGFIAEQLGEGPEAYDQFIDTLGQEGATEQDVLDEITRQLELGDLFNTVTEGHRDIGQEQLEQAFRERRDELGAPQSRQLRNIVVENESEAERIADAVESGADFAEQARESSLDGSTREDGGDLGALTRDQLEEGYGEAAFNAAEGEVFGPVENEFGFNIGLVEDVIPAQEATFDEVADELEAQLQNEQTLEAWRDWLAERIRAADVTYAAEYRPDDPDAPPELGADPSGQQQTQPEPDE